MKNDIIIQSIEVDCPFCNRKHHVEVHKKVAEVEVKGENVSFDEYFYLCPFSKDGKHTFITKKLNEANEMRMRNAYRKMKGLLTSDEIVSIRAKYGVTQVELAKLLGLGEATISRYESKAIQDETYDSLLRFVDESPMGMLRFMKKNRHKFSEEKFREIDAKLIKNHDEYGMELMKRQALQSDYVHYWYASDYNGNRHISISKIESVVTYFAASIQPLYKIRLMGLLWYSDMLNYERFGVSMTGLAYIHESPGMMPIGHDKILNLNRVNAVEEFDADLNSRYLIKPCDVIGVSELTSDDLSVLASVLRQFKTMTDLEFSEHMKKENAYLQTILGQVIPYSNYAPTKE